MRIYVMEDKTELGSMAASLMAARIEAAIAERGEARIVLSTGMSQFEMLEALVRKDLDWSKVTMFHLDEYVALPQTHIASFRRYLNERFIGRVSLKAAYLVDGEGDVKQNIAFLTEKLREKPIDVGAIGIGENGHIAFNDPPADFATTAAYHVVDLDERCKQQQVGEGWFPTAADVPTQAISMTAFQIMQCRSIVSAVPHACKADAVAALFRAKEPDANVPCSLLKTHHDIHLVLDRASFSACEQRLLEG